MFQCNFNYFAEADLGLLQHLRWSSLRSASALISIFREKCDFTKMVNTCSAVYCKIGYKKRENKEDKIPEKHPVFGFPDSRPDLKAKWVKFVSRKSRLPTKNSGISAKHFEERFLKKGLRTTLRRGLNPVPTLYCNIESIPKSLLASQTTGRAVPKDRSTLEDENSKFCNIDRISNHEDLEWKFMPYQLLTLKWWEWSIILQNRTPSSTFNPTSIWNNCSW